MPFHSISLEREIGITTQLPFPYQCAGKNSSLQNKSSGMEANIVITNNETIGKVCEVTDNKTKVICKCRNCIHSD